MISMAESWFHDGNSAEHFVTVILYPSTILSLFLDCSSVVEYTRELTIYES